jgi:hypothetical protein
MLHTGQFVIALSPATDPAAFEAHVQDVLFNDPHVMALSRITRGFSHRLLKVVHGAKGLPPRYVWEVTADLVGNERFDISENTADIQAGIKDFGVVVEVLQTEAL